LNNNDIENEKLINQFLNILINKNIKTVFQPIISLRDGSVYGYEALSRGPENTDMESPQILFEYAEKYQMLWELEFLCRTKALEAAHFIKPCYKLFLNVNPNIIHDKKFAQGFTKEYLEKFSIDPERLIFEITEREAINSIADFLKTIQNYKDQNYQIAIDDAGAGYSGLNLISDVRPHYIKLDMNLINDVDKDVTKQSLIKSMCEFASLSNTKIIAEGIETESELLKLIEIGVHFGQGFYIQRPDILIEPIGNRVLDLINDANSKKNHFWGFRVSDIYIKNICRPLKSINSYMLIGQIYEMMKKDDTLPGLCITEEEVVIGVITRNELFKIISGQYGYTLFSNKPIKNIMDKSFMSVEYDTTIDIVAKKAMQRESEKIYDFIVITEEEKYIGIVTVKELLEKSIEIEVLNARHLNPLSGLPGNLLIEQQLEKCLNTKERKHILYFDIDNFKAYNDVYGFENGDKVLKCLTQIIRSNISKDEFIGHIGGDDFMAIIAQNNSAQICSNIIKEFDSLIQSYYNQDDINKGFISTKNRYGTEEDFPLLSLSIVVVYNQDFDNIYDLGEKAGKLKRKCKEIPGSNFALE